MFFCPLHNGAAPGRGGPVAYLPNPDASCIATLSLPAGGRPPPLHAAEWCEQRPQTRVQSSIPANLRVHPRFCHIASVRKVDVSPSPWHHRQANEAHIGPRLTWSSPKPDSGFALSRYSLAVES